MKLYALAVVTAALGLAACDPAPPSITVRPDDWAPRPQAASVAVGPADWAPKSQPAPEVRKNLVLVFDGSGSMEGENLSVAKRAVGSYVGGLDESVKMALVVFDGRGLRTVSELGASQAEVLAEIGGIRANGGTPLGDAIGVAYEMLAARSRATGVAEEYHLAVITDGEADPGQPLDPNVELVLGTPVRVFTIGFGLGADHALNRPGTRYVSAANEAELKKGLGQILAEAPDP